MSDTLPFEFRLGPPNSLDDMNMEGKSCVVGHLEGKLEDLEVDSLEPSVRRRVEVLREIQTQHDAIKVRFLKEKTTLEAKYKDMYEPLFMKRYQIVNGIVEVDGVTKATEETMNQYRDIKGVPEFWLTALKTNDVIGDEIRDFDEEALTYLNDIRSLEIDDPNGFRLEFHFDPNPFFKNTMLEKTYIMTPDEDEAILEKAIGTKIEWHSGKNLILKGRKKKLKMDLESAKSKTEFEDYESFFNFFDPPKVPQKHEELDMESAELLQHEMEQDYDIGITIRDKIIPRAVAWFTGEADNLKVFDLEEDEEIFDEDEDENEDEEKKQKGATSVGEGHA